MKKQIEKTKKKSEKTKIKYIKVIILSTDKKNNLIKNCV